MQPIIENLMTTDPNLRIVFKEFPVFRGDSIFAAKAALAAEKQGKYLQFHQALMKDEQRLTRQRVLEIAQTIGLDIEQLQQDIDSSELDDAVQSNMELASDLGLIGTPAFIITSYPASEDLKVFFVPGETSEANLQSLIEQARSE